MHLGRALGGLALLLIGCGSEVEPAAVQPPGVEAAPVATAVAPELAQGLGALEAELLHTASPEVAPSEELSQKPWRGTPPARIAEPRLVIPRGSPHELLTGVLTVLASRDPAALARLVLDPGRRPQLTADDAADARRRFLSSSVRPYWDRVARALRAGAFTVEEHGAEALVLVRVGGAAGTYRILLRKEGEAWYLAG